MIRYRKDVLARLKAKGYNPAVLRRDKILAESTIQTMRNGDGNTGSFKTLNTLCKLLQCDVFDVLEYVPDDEE